MPGGEDTVVASEKKMLEENGHQVRTYYRHNSELDKYSLVEKWKLLTSTTWNKASYAEIKQAIQEFKPDVCHVHNFLPLISPSVSAACKEESVPLVQTLHNYRQMCANGLLLRNNKVCETCVGASAYRSVSRKCYRDSHLQTFAVARMLENTDWQQHADAYLCFTSFMKQKYVAHGLPAEKIHIKPNFVEHLTHADVQDRPYLIYVGRLEENKGVELFKEIGEKLPVPLLVVGDGVLSSALQGVQNVKLLGAKSSKETRELIHNASALLFPSRSYEGMPMTILEAFAEKTLVIASDLGAMQSMVRHKENGLLFDPGSSVELLDKINFVLENESLAKAMTERAFRDVEEQYSRTKNYELLMNVYEQVIG